MTAPDVIAVLDLLTNAGIVHWIAGGWGIDALVGSQTRAHSDLDLHISSSDATAVRDLLAETGYAVAKDELPFRVEMVHPSGGRVDLHPFHLDNEGSARSRMKNGGWWIFDQEALSGVGAIAGRSVRCVSVTEQIHSHLEFEPRPIDRADMALLTAHFSVPLPRPYK